MARITVRGTEPGSAELLDEEADHLAAHLLDRLSNAGEGRIRRLGDGRVVEPDDGDVVRDAPAGGAQHLEGAGGHRIRGGEDRVDVGSRGEDPSRGFGTALLA